MDSSDMKTIIFLGVLMTTAAHSVVIIGIRNFDMDGGRPIIDRNGNLVDPDEMEWKVGSFDPLFAMTLGSLDVETDRNTVETAFNAAAIEEPKGRFVANGLVNSQVNVLDTSFVLRRDQLFFLFKHTPALGGESLMIISFGTFFPEVDGLGNGGADYGPEINNANILFGGRAVSGIDTSGLPGPLNNPTFSNGIMIGANIPEPSSCFLLGLSAFILLGRRQR